MTDYNVQIRNRIGRLQFDGMYTNYYLKEDGFNFHIVASGSPPYKCSITFSGYYPIDKAPIFAYRLLSDVTWMSAHHFIMSGGLIHGVSIWLESGANFYIDWRLYALDYPGEAIDYGLRFFDARGKCIYSSDESTLRTLEESRSVNTYPYTISLTDQKSFYFAQPYGFGYIIIPTGGDSSLFRLYHTGIGRASASQIVLRKGLVYSITGGYVPTGVSGGLSPYVFVGVIPS